MDAKDGSVSFPVWNWGEETTVSSLLLYLQTLLSNPQLDEGCILNGAAAKMLKEAPLTYKQMILDCITASLRVDGKCGSLIVQPTYLVALGILHHQHLGTLYLFELLEDYSN